MIGGGVCFCFLFIFHLFLQRLCSAPTPWTTTTTHHHHETENSLLERRRRIHRLLYLHASPSLLLRPPTPPLLNVYDVPNRYVYYYGHVSPTLFIYISLFSLSLLQPTSQSLRHCRRLLGQVTNERANKMSRIIILSPQIIHCPHTHLSPSPP